MATSKSKVSKFESFLKKKGWKKASYPSDVKKDIKDGSVVALSYMVSPKKDDAILYDETDGFEGVVSWAQYRGSSGLDDVDDFISDVYDEAFSENSSEDDLYETVTYNKRMLELNRKVNIDKRR